MKRPLLIDSFPFHDEVDILECRLVEMYPVVDWFVIVEADVTHQDRPKPSYFMEHQERFEPWADKIIRVWATGLPTIKDDPDPWAREHAQREHIVTGLAGIPGINEHSILMQSDVDEIPSRLAARNVRPGRQVVGFEQRGHFWAVDWQYPLPWYGTTATTIAGLDRLGQFRFSRMRDLRNLCPIKIPNGGWHLSWLGGKERALKKLGSFCHPEVEDRIHGAIVDEEMFYWREGWHVDGQRMAPVDVDKSWPKWIADGNAPSAWYRPRDGAHIAHGNAPKKLV